MPCRPAVPAHPVHRGGASSLPILGLLATTLICCSGRHSATTAAPVAGPTPSTIYLDLQNDTPAAVFGTPLTLFATVAPSAAGGTITFMDGSTLLGTATAGGTSQAWGASFTTDSLTVGIHSLSATFGGDATFAAATTLTPLALIVVPAGAPVVTLTSSVATIPAGQSLTFTATVAFGGTPAAEVTGIGNVTFLDGTQVLKEVAVAGGGASWTTSALGAGTHFMTATFVSALPASPTTTSAILDQTVD